MSINGRATLRRAGARILDSTAIANGWRSRSSLNMVQQCMVLKDLLSKVTDKDELLAFLVYRKQLMRYDGRLARFIALDPSIYRFARRFLSTQDDWIRFADRAGDCFWLQSMSRREAARCVVLAA